MAQIKRANAAARPSWTTAQTVEALRAYGIDYLAASHNDDRASGKDKMSTRPPISQLLRALACSHEPRVRDAMIGLLLLHPEIARDVVRVVSRARLQGDDELAEQTITLALAAIYLQRIWWFQLALTDGASPALDEALFAPWWLERNLPPPSIGYGETGLRWLATYEQERTGVAANFAGDWQNQARHVITQGRTPSAVEQRPADASLPLDRQALRRMFYVRTG